MEIILLQDFTMEEGTPSPAYNRMDGMLPQFPAGSRIVP
jgi:hypothetical protein